MRSAHSAAHGRPARRRKAAAERRGRKAARIASAAAGLFLLGFLLLRLTPYPELSAFLERQNSTAFYDRNGRLLYVLPLEDGLRREYRALGEIPERLQRIFIRAEDRRFYFHPGVDAAAILRAVRQNVREKRSVSGASTITMQLARMIRPRTGGARLSDKIREAVDALRLEARLSKKKILELYLNSVPFGHQAEGVASAARAFFGRSLDELSAAQMLALAVIPRRPAYYSPFGSPRNSYQAAREIGRRTGIRIREDEWAAALSPRGSASPNSCPHLISWICAGYAGRGERIPDRLDLSVDSDLNEMIADAVYGQSRLYADARISNGAALVIDNLTGRILAWVGNGAFSDPDGGQINGVTVRRQAGSAMKPFLYALALEKGFEPSDVLPDIPQDFGGAAVYVPLNFNNMYNGPVRLRVCLASSLNVPAVYLLYRIGIDNYMEKLDECGFESLRGTRGGTGLSLALGSGEVTLYELVRAFSVFPRDGTLPRLSFLRDGASESGGQTAGASAERGGASAEKGDRASGAGGSGGGVRVFGTDTARIVCDFLSDRNARALGFGRAAVFDTPYPCIFKTGTSNQFQDIVALGATSRYTAGVWLGNFSGETVIKKTGSSIPAGIVREILDRLTENGAKDGAAAPFPQPERYRKTGVCTLSGMLPSDDCPSVAPEYVRIGGGESAATAARDAPSAPAGGGRISGGASSGKCLWHFRRNGRTEIRYPPEYQHWASGRNMSGVAVNGGFGAGADSGADFSGGGFGAENYGGAAWPAEAESASSPAGGGRISGGAADSGGGFGAQIAASAAPAASAVSAARDATTAAPAAPAASAVSAARDATTATPAATAAATPAATAAESRAVSAAQLDFLYPTDGAVFIYDGAAPASVQSLCVRAFGGPESAAELFLDGASAGRAEDRFVWYVPLTRGAHTLTVRCGQERKTVTYSVK